MANDSKHTPGPWGWEYAQISLKPVALSGEYQDVFIATSDIDGHTFVDISPANARLIRATPELLALLEKALPIIEKEAERRATVAAPYNEEQRGPDSYWTEMLELSHEIAVEIDKAYGRGAQDG